MKYKMYHLQDSYSEYFRLFNYINGLTVIDELGKNGDKIRRLLETDSDFIKDDKTLIMFYYYINNTKIQLFLNKYSNIKQYAEITNKIKEIILAEGDIASIIDALGQEKNYYTKIEVTQLRMIKAMNYKLANPKRNLTNNILFVKEAIDACREYNDIKMSSKKPKYDNIIELIHHECPKANYDIVVKLLSKYSNKGYFNIDKLISNISNKELQKQYKQKRMEEKLNNKNSLDNYDGFDRFYYSQFLL